MDWRVALFDVNLDAAELAAVTGVLNSRWLAMGNVTQTFEREFAAALGVESAVAVSSGTAALHLAVMSLGLGSDDEVILPSLNFVAAAAVVALMGARPVFAEVKGGGDLTLDPDDVARCITSRTKAIIVMHYGGYACDMDALMALARQYHLSIIEDAAHAPLVSTGSGTLGTLGDVGCFSFFATKNITMGEGGMLIARDAGVVERARALRSHCMTVTSWDKQQGGSGTYDVEGLGLNYRPTDIGAAIGRVQMRKVAASRERLQKLAGLYRELLKELSDISLPFAERDGNSAYHLFPILLPDARRRTDFQRRLKAEGIQSSVHYPPTHLFTYYRRRYGYRPGDLPVTEDVTAREVSLPLHSLMTESDVELVASVIRSNWGGHV